MTPAAPILAQIARWHDLPWSALAIAAALTFAAASSLAVAGRQR